MELFTQKYHKLGMIVFLIMFNVGMSLPLKKAVAQSVLIDLPEFIHCTCDSGTFCLTDDDVIKLHTSRSSNDSTSLPDPSSND